MDTKTKALFANPTETQTIVFLIKWNSTPTFGGRIGQGRLRDIFRGRAPEGRISVWHSGLNGPFNFRKLHNWIGSFWTWMSLFERLSQVNFASSQICSGHWSM